MKVDNDIYHLKEGDLLLIPAKSRYQPLDGGACKYYFAHFDSKGIRFNNSEEYIAEVRQKNIDFIKESPYGFKRFNDFNVSVLQNIHIADKSISDYLEAKMKATLSPTNESSIEKTFEICANFTDILMLLEKIGESNSSLGKVHRQSYDNVKNIADYINENYMQEIDSKIIETRKYPNDLQ